MGPAWDVRAVERYVDVWPGEPQASVATPARPVPVPPDPRYTYAQLTLSLTFTQATPSAVWVIVQNLGYYPTVTTVDETQELVVGEVTYPTLSTAVVTFSQAVSGTAYLRA